MRQPIFSAVSILVAAFSSGAVQGQSAAPASPSAAYSAHVEKARGAAQGVARNILNLCKLPDPKQTRPGGRMAAAAEGFEPGKVFDNLYFVGLPDVSAWAVATPQGIILIDALNNTKEAETVIVPNMRKLGLDPAQIKYVVISHGHGDHYGGSQWLKEQFHPRLIASDVDWAQMNGKLQFDNPAWSKPPQRDMTIADGDKLSLGGTTLTLYVTPGHTPGTISILLPVTDRGRRHVAAFWGGTAFNFAPSVAAFETYARSAQRFGALAHQAGADVLLSNHGFVDNTAPNLKALRQGPGSPNPFVVGREQVGEFFRVASECAAARGAALAARE